MPVKTLSVAAIRNGTVIDHIAPGQALKIIRLLKLAHHRKVVTVGLNLPSQEWIKDLIKVEDWELPLDEANRVAILAPHATINIIREYEVSQKYQVEIPSFVIGVVPCINPHCVSNHEHMLSYLNVEQWKKIISLQCRYCRKTFSYQDSQHQG